MKKTIFILIVIIITFQASGQVVSINQADSININSWGNVEITNNDLYHVQLVTTRAKAAKLISNQVAARKTNVLTLPDGNYIIQYINKTYTLNYSDSLYQWTRIKDCRAFVENITYSFLQPH